MLEGKKIGNYSIIKMIGQGGMGNVYKAWDVKRKRFVGFKLLKERVRSIHHDLFQREIDLLASLDHPNIVPIYDVGFYIGAPFFVMGFLEGASLFDIIILHQKNKKGFALPFFHAVMKDVIQALHHAHSKGIFHRDLKPENILVSPNKRAFLLDFGLGKLVHDKKIIPENCIMGTPQYMAPEQIVADELDHRTDIYSLGMVMYVCLTGRLPFMTKNPMDGARRRLKDRFPEPVERNRAIPVSVNDIVMRCLALDPADRYQIVSDVSLALTRALSRKKDTKSLDSGFIKNASERLAAKAQPEATGLPFPRKPAAIAENLTNIFKVLEQTCTEFNKQKNCHSIVAMKEIEEVSASDYHHRFGTVNTSSTEVRFVTVTLNNLWEAAFCFKVKILKGTLHLLVGFISLKTTTVDLSFDVDFAPWLEADEICWEEIFKGLLHRFEKWSENQ